MFYLSTSPILCRPGLVSNSEKEGSLVGTEAKQVRLHFKVAGRKTGRQRYFHTPAAPWPRVRRVKETAGSLQVPCCGSAPVFPTCCEIVSSSLSEQVSENKRVWLRRERIHETGNGDSRASGRDKAQKAGRVWWKTQVGPFRNENLSVLAAGKRLLAPVSSVQTLVEGRTVGLHRLFRVKSCVKRTFQRITGTIGSVIGLWVAASARVHCSLCSTCLLCVLKITHRYHLLLQSNVSSVVMPQSPVLYWFGAGQCPACSP